MWGIGLAELCAHIKAGNDLNREEASAAAHQLAEGQGSLEEREALLLALQEKGESPVEVAAFASVFRELARDPELGELAEHAFDFAGTGGDKSGTANLSTMASMLVASMGVPVVKHGNRSITSKCGSADLMGALGFPLEADNAKLRECLERFHFTFLFAPRFHPAWKHVAEVRQSLAAKGHRTIFNILGPLINPARTPYQVMGVYAKHWVGPLAGALGSLGVRRGLLANGEPFEGGTLDELSCAGTTFVAGAGGLDGLSEPWLPEKFGLSRCPLEDLKGGDLDRNIAILNDLAAGKATAGLTDTVALNAGVALWVAEQASTPEGGISRAREQIESGKLLQWLQRLRTYLT